MVGQNCTKKRADNHAKTIIFFSCELLCSNYGKVEISNQIELEYWRAQKNTHQKNIFMFLQIILYFVKFEYKKFEMLFNVHLSVFSSPNPSKCPHPPPQQSDKKTHQ